jgi:3-hydroxyisobutyrate dehydrogenase
MKDAAVGVIGLGIMGKGMAANLLAKGFVLNVWNRTPSKMDALVREGARGAESPADLAGASEMVLICVTDEAAVHEALFGSGGVVEGARPGALIIDLSTIDPRASRRHADALNAKGLSMLDAPVSGSKEGADQGTLSIMVGGQKKEFEKALPVFESMGSNVVHVGERCGDGQIVKLMNQLLAAGHTLVMSEALLLAQAHWSQKGFSVKAAVASPKNPSELEKAAASMQDPELELVVLDCMGFGPAAARSFKSRCGRPVICPQSLVARVTAEVIGA